MALGVPAVAGVIDRRILLNYRVEADEMAAALPGPFDPLTVDGYAIGGTVSSAWATSDRPGSPPPWASARRTPPTGSPSPGNARTDRRTVGTAREEGVYVPRRDTSSRLFALGGGRLFSDRHFLAEFDVVEGDDRYEGTMASRAGDARVHVAGERADHLPDDSVFNSLAEASAFFERGSVGLSATGDPDDDTGASHAREDYYAIELRTDQWAVEPLAVEAHESSYFEDTSRFAEGTVELDHALLMADVEHTWHEKEPPCPSG